MRLPGPRQKSRTRGGGASDRNCRCEFVRPISHPECPHLAGQSAFPCHHPSELLIKPEGASVRRLQVTLSVAKVGARLELYMKETIPAESASGVLDARINELGDWRGRMLAKVREIIHQADPEIVEEWKWVKPTSPGTPVFSHGGIICTAETYKNVVKMTFAKGAALKDPSRLFNSSLEGSVRRAIDIHEGDKIDEAALKDLIRAAVALNLKGRDKPKPGRRSSKRAD